MTNNSKDPKFYHYPPPRSESWMNCIKMSDKPMLVSECGMTFEDHWRYVNHFYDEKIYDSPNFYEKNKTKITCDDPFHLMHGSVDLEQKIWHKIRISKIEQELNKKNG